MLQYGEIGQVKNLPNQLYKFLKEKNARKKQLVIWGTGDHSESISPIICQQGYRILCFIDDNKPKSDFNSIIPYFSNLEELVNSRILLSSRNIYSVVAISNKFKNLRVINYEKLSEYGVKPLSLIDTSSLIRIGTSIGKGVQIMCNVTINSKSTIGDYCLINTGANLEHHCALSEGVEVGPGATLLGRVKVDKFAQIGAGAIVLPGVIIGAHTLIGAGSVVTKNLPKNCIAVGNPAKIVKYF